MPACRAIVRMITRCLEKEIIPTLRDVRNRLRVKTQQPCSTPLRARGFFRRPRTFARLAARARGRTALHPRTSGAAKIEPQRSPDQRQRLTKSRFQKAHIVRRNPALDVGEESQPRRRARDLRHVHQVEPAPIDLGRIHRGGRFRKSSIQARSFKPRSSIELLPRRPPRWILRK